MARKHMSVGDRIVRAGAQFVVQEFQENGAVILQAMMGRDKELLSRTQLEKELLSGEAKFKFDEGTGDATNASPFDLLHEAIKSEIKRREHYVRALDKATQTGSASSNVERVIAEVSEFLSDPNAPSRATLFRWFKAWKGSGRSLMSLLPKYGQRGRRGLQLGSDASAILLKVLYEKYWVTEQPTLKSVLPDIRAAFEEANRARELLEFLKTPSEATIYRFEQTAIDPYERVALREGKRAAEHKFRKVSEGLSVEAPLDVVQIDHTILDIQVLAPVDGIVARPRFTVALDLYSRMPVGIYVGFSSPGYESLMRCLRQAILPKDQLLARTSVAGTWPCHGLPRTVVVDNGGEFHSESFREACASLGIGIVNHPVREPRYKGAVERFFHSVNKGLLNRLSGKTFSNIIEKGEYDSVAKAAIPFEVFRDILLKWIVDVYARRFHRGIQDQPVDRWNKGVAEFPIDLPENRDELNILLGEVVERKLTRKGIEIHNAFYNSDELNVLFRRYGENTDITLKRDPLDLGCIYVFDEFENVYIEVPCLDAGMIGRTLWEHKLTRKLLRQNSQSADEKYDPTAQMAEIWRQVEQYTAGGKVRANARVARLGEYEERRPKVGSPRQISAPEVADDELDDFDSLIEHASQNDWDRNNE